VGKLRAGLRTKRDGVKRGYAEKEGICRARENRFKCTLEKERRKPAGKVLTTIIGQEAFRKLTREEGGGGRRGSLKREEDF